VPRPDNTYAHVVGLWDEIGLPRSYDYVEPTGTAASLKFARDHYDPMYWDEDQVSLGYFFSRRLRPGRLGERPLVRRSAPRAGVT